MSEAEEMTEAEIAGGAVPGTPAPNAGDVVALAATGAEFLEQARASSAGRVARAVLKLPGLKVVMLALAEGRALAEHEAPGSANLMCLQGRVTLTAGDDSWVLNKDDLVEIPPRRHAVHADTDAVCLLTVRLG